MRKLFSFQPSQLIYSGQQTDQIMYTSSECKSKNLLASNPNQTLPADLESENEKSDYFELKIST